MFLFTAKSVLMLVRSSHGISCEKNTLQFTQASIKMPTQMIKDIKTVTLTVKASVVYILMKVETIISALESITK